MTAVPAAGGGAPSPEALASAAAGGDRRALARLLSLVERGGAPARQVAALAYRSGREAATVGITGAPGAGKSTLTDRLIAAARAEGGPVGVLAVDPSSPFSGGAILGDRVRMQDHALDREVFIRSIATRGHLGGLALSVPEAIRVLAAAGLPLVLVETVGVGQVEVEVAAATDTTVVVVNPRWGDAIQANKAGLLEIADVFVINKADNPGAAETQRDLEQMLDLSTPGDWRPPIVQTVAAKGEGVDELWGAIRSHQEHLASTGRLQQGRRDRLEREFKAVLSARIARDVEQRAARGELGDIVDDLLARRIDPYEAADRALGEQ
ncbi:MAG TPA: methylmalonyl Co-A mutase-associated GTPase MeaB [Acidimicrobiales bacterium]|nr:methylmalonyl Co-A mutase-associated GTPase MeaB [Acidimicrobiales bacterium]